MLKHLDWISVLLYFALVTIGWVCIYATGYNEHTTNLMDFSQHASKQLFFVCTSVLLILFILAIEAQFYENSAEIFLYFCYTALGRSTHLWEDDQMSQGVVCFGPVTIQPAEFAKTATALLFAKQLSHIQTDIRRFKDLLNVLVIIVVPCFLIILQPDPGSTLVYGAFIFALNREGMSSSLSF